LRWLYPPTEAFKNLKTRSVNSNVFDAHYYFARASFAIGNIERSDLAKPPRLVTKFSKPHASSLALRMLGRREETRGRSEKVSTAERALK
jgi:hypothetical protein